MVEKKAEKVLTEIVSIERVVCCSKCDCLVKNGLVVLEAGQCRSPYTLYIGVDIGFVLPWREVETIQPVSRYVEICLPTIIGQR